VFNFLKKQQAGRVFVVVGVVVGVVTLAVALIYSVSPALAIPAALGAAVLAMIACGVAEGFWDNRKVNQATIPGGGGLTFEDKAVETAEKINERVDEQMSDLNERLYEVEKVALEDPDVPTDTKE